MKKIGNLLVALGVLLLVLAIGGKFVGKPGVVIGFKVMNIIMLANTALLFAVLVKVSGKK